jgi:outer membrane protein assembly factor BamB
MARKVNYFTFLFLVFYFTFFFRPSAASADWPMVAANPERTSWVNENPVITSNVEWYRPIDAYIPPNFQVIAANDLVYMSSARGLYAFRYDTGALVWQFDTELPLGNSPTIATINGTSMAFVGGYDKKIHALNALTGQHLWEFSGAKAGYDANPVVVNNTVYIGNRDGHFYALNAASGLLVWQYPAEGQDGLGPIHHPAAYKNNTLFFATDYQYGYALNSNGTLKWKSPQKLPGDGYVSYWPMAYTNPADNKTYVIYSANVAYREYSDPGAMSVTPDGEWSFLDSGLGSYGGNVAVDGKTFKNYSAVATWLGTKPYRRLYAILDDNAGGAEYVMNINGNPAYMPVLPVYNPNAQHPPVLGSDGLIYVTNNISGGGVSVMGWKFGTPYFFDNGIDHYAPDEPQVISAAGDYILRVLCCNRLADAAPVSGGSLQYYWNYTLGDSAPGFDTKIYYLGGDPGALSGLFGQFGSVQGIYGSHGDQNPLIAYKGRTYVQRGNSIIAFGNNGNKCPGARTEAGHCYPVVSSASQSSSVSIPSETELKDRLNRVVTSASVLLKPAYFSDSHFSTTYNHMDNYFEHPGDTIYTLSLAYPHLSVAAKTTVKNFLKNTFIPRYITNGLVLRIGWDAGKQQRDSVLYPTDLNLNNYPDTWRNGYEERWSFILGNQYIGVNPFTFYALARYVETVAPEDANTVYQAVKNHLTDDSRCWMDCFKAPHPYVANGNNYLINHPWELNAYIAGYSGFTKLFQLAGSPGADTSLNTRANTEATRLKTLLLANFTMDTPWTGSEDYSQNFLNISRNFIMLTPEIADLLRQSKLSQIQTGLNSYNTVAPYWFVPKFNSAVAESGYQNLYDYPSNFQARAWILKSPREELIKWLDVPAFERGDLFYIQNLVAAIEAPTNGVPTGTPKPGDANSDGHVDGIDYVIWLNHYGQNVSGPGVGDFNSNDVVDGVDYVTWLNNYGL